MYSDHYCFCNIIIGRHLINKIFPKKEINIVSAFPKFYRISGFVYLILFWDRNVVFKTNAFHRILMINTLLYVELAL